MVVIKETVPLSEKDRKAFKGALNKACGEINEAAKLSSEIFDGDELKMVRRELARLMEIIDLQLLARLSRHR
jgi:hypothetical protein